MERSISEVARIAGVTSRTLRHYQDMGLLEPSRIGTNGYRYYDGESMVRLQRILLLRQLGLGIAAIAEAIEAGGDDVNALSVHLDWLRAEHERLERQIASVEATILSIREEKEIMAEEMFDGFDHTQYKDEVEQRWGKKAFEDSDRWWRRLSADERQAFMDEHTAIAAEWESLRAAGEPIDSEAAQALASRHHAWIGAGWGGRQPDADQLAGLASMYVDDERFAANYGGVEGATYVRDALTHYALERLA